MTQARAEHAATIAAGNRIHTATARASASYQGIRKANHGSRTERALTRGAEHDVPLVTPPLLLLGRESAIVRLVGRSAFRLGRMSVVRR
jgi:hypothetical protein